MHRQTARWLRTGLAVLLWVGAGQAQRITTVAGGGLGDHGPAVEAPLYAPTGIALDVAGNLYIAEFRNSRIRRVDAASGTISTVVGDGTTRFAGDGGPATAASLYFPEGIAVGARGDLYVADTYHCRVRRVDAAGGTISTVTGDGSTGFSGDGGPAASATLGSPVAVALDSRGNLYVADGRRIRRIDAATGTITTVAGNGSGDFSGDGGPATAASLNVPFGIALDAQGNLFIADTAHHRIRRVDGATGLIATVAGDGNAGFSGDGGPAASASLNWPHGIAFDAQGNLYIADGGNNRVRRVAAISGIITTVAGDGREGYSGDGGLAVTASLNGPYGLAVDARGGLYVADSGNNRVRRVDAVTGLITTVAGSGTTGFSGDGGPAANATLSFPAGVGLDVRDNLYIADSGVHRVRRVDAATGVITTVAGNGTQGFSGDGGPAASASLNGPSGVALDGAGNLYVADIGNHRVRRVDAATGLITTVAGNGTMGFSGDGGPAVSAGLDFHWGAGVACDAEGNLYIAEPASSRVRRVDAATGVITTVAGDGTWEYPEDGALATGASVGGPRAVALDTQGSLYISSEYRIRRVDAATGVIATVAGGGCGYADADWEYCHGDGIAAVSAELTTPDGIAVDHQGNLYFCESDGNANRVRRVDAGTGVLTTVAGDFGEGFAGDGGPAVGALLYSPRAVALDVRGNLYIADATNGRVRRVEGKTASAVTADAPHGPPRAFALHQNVPNPFNAQTAIVYELSEASSVTLAVYGLLGQPVRTLAAARQPAGRHRMVWDGRDSQGLPVASGVYVCQLTTRGQRAVRRMLLLR